MCLSRKLFGTLAIATAVVAFSPAISIADPSLRSSSADDVIGWCSTWISDLQNARWSAQLEAQNGNIEGAAYILMDELERKDHSIGTGLPDPVPHTADALHVSARIVRETFAISADEPLPGRARAEIRYLMADSVYGLIEWAYYNLDSQFYHSVSRTCRDRGRCRNGDDYDHYPSEYFRNVRQLVFQILDLQLKLAPMQATDYLELGIARTVSIGAKNLLLSSLLRRSLSCPIAKLEFIEKQIDSFLCGGSSVSRRDQVRTIRNLLTDARDSLSATSCRDVGYGR